MTWVMEHLQLLIGAAAAIAYFLNRRRGSEGEESDQQSARPSAAGSDEQAERTRRVQEEIRRKIAERRGEHPVPVDRTMSAERVPPPLRPAQVPPLDPFGGPTRRILRKLEEAAANMEPSAEDPAAAIRAEEAARRARQAEELRELEVARETQERYAAALAAAQKKQREKAILQAPVLQKSFRAALRDPQELRRAVILREVLGPPVALR